MKSLYENEFASYCSKLIRSNEVTESDPDSGSWLREVSKVTR